MSLVRNKRLELVEQIRNKYYGPNFEPLSTRATKMTEDGTERCEYKTLYGKCCAIGQLDPKFDWEQGGIFANVYSHHAKNCKNERRVIELAKRDGWHSDDYATLEFAEKLQELHDHPDVAKYNYAKLKECVGTQD